MPPVDPFDDESTDVTFEEWYPTLECAADWNGWSEGETLTQLAGNFRRRALTEWNLLSLDDKKSLKQAADILCSCLDPFSQTMAAQEFRHLVQQEVELVSHHIRRLEKSFQKAYGHDGMLVETRNTLLYGQLQEGFKYELMKAPAVSGTKDYQELRISARNEERRLAELVKRCQYLGQVPQTAEVKFILVALTTGTSIKAKNDSKQSLRCF